MDKNSLIIGLVLLFISIAPLYLISLNRKNKKKKMLQLLSTFAEKYNCIISQYDICSEKIIGMDETKKFVFFLAKENDSTVENYIDLSGIKNCKMVHSTKTIKENEESQKITDHIELCFTYLNSSKPEVKWEFYNQENNSQISSELQVVQKWSKLISRNLKSK